MLEPLYTGNTTCWWLLSPKGESKSINVTQAHIVGVALMDRWLPWMCFHTVQLLCLYILNHEKDQSCRTVCFMETLYIKNNPEIENIP